MKGFEDLEPIVQDHDEVAAIAYQEEFHEVFGYFRRIVKDGEVSERGFELTSVCIGMNPGNYTVWWYRRKCLVKLKKNLKEELKYMNSIVLDNPKNYQVWYHRQRVVELLHDDCSGEIEFINSALEMDSKNYHAWQYRQWIVDFFEIYDDELKHMDHFISEDVLNNSAWNHRFFVLCRKALLSAKHRIEEISAAFNLIKTHEPMNEAAWNFIQGLLVWYRNDKFLPNSKQDYPDCMKVLDYVKSISKEFPSNRFAIHCHLTCNQTIIKWNQKVDKSIVAESIQLCDKLIQLDPTRNNYWTYLKTEWIQSFE